MLHDRCHTFHKWRQLGNVLLLWRTRWAVLSRGAGSVQIIASVILHSSLKEPWRVTLLLFVSCRIVPLSCAFHGLSTSGNFCVSLNVFFMKEVMDRGREKCCQQTHAW